MVERYKFGIAGALLANFILSSGFAFLSYFWDEAYGMQESFFQLFIQGFFLFVFAYLVLGVNWIVLIEKFFRERDKKREFYSSMISTIIGFFLSIGVFVSDWFFVPSFDTSIIGIFLRNLTFIFLGILVQLTLAFIQRFEKYRDEI